MDPFPLKIKWKNTPLLLIVKRRATKVFRLRDNSKGDGRSLHSQSRRRPTEPNVWLKCKKRGCPAVKGRPEHLGFPYNLKLPER
jgi:hypothetical protein